MSSKRKEKRSKVKEKRVALFTLTFNLLPFAFPKGAS